MRIDKHTIRLYLQFLFNKKQYIKELERFDI